MAKDSKINIFVISGSRPEVLQYVLIARKLYAGGITMHIAASRRHVYEFLLQQGWAHAADIIRLKLIQLSDIDAFKDEIRWFIEIVVEENTWAYNVPEPEPAFPEKVKRKLKGSAIWKELRETFRKITGPP